MWIGIPLGLHQYCQTKLVVLFITNMTICMQIYSQINSVLVELFSKRSSSCQKWKLHTQITGKAHPSGQNKLVGLYIDAMEIYWAAHSQGYAWYCLNSHPSTKIHKKCTQIANKAHTFWHKQVRGLVHYYYGYLHVKLWAGVGCFSVIKFNKIQIKLQVF